MASLHLHISTGDSREFVIALEKDGAAFTPDSGSGALIFTVKNSYEDSDDEAVFQKASGAGITLSGSNATVTILRADSLDLCLKKYFVELLWEDAESLLSQPVASGILEVDQRLTREQQTSVPVVTTDDPLPFSSLPAETHAATSKAIPVDADEIPLADSAASFVLKKLTWANIKATLKTYFDGLYPSGSGTSTGTNTGDQDLSGYATDGELSAEVSARANADSDIQTALEGKAAEVPVSSGCVLGDSTTAAYAGQNATTVYLLDSGNSQAGSTLTSHATGGETIDQQKVRWVADASKATYDWIIVQVGHNDVNYTDAASVAIGKLQSLIDTINTGKKASAKIILCTMTPAKSRYIAFWGDSNGAIAYARWQSINTAIMGGASAITGADVRVSSHTTAMDDGAGNLNVPHDTGDGIHTTNAARETQAAEWAKALHSLGFWKKSLITPPPAAAHNPVSGQTTIKGNKVLIGNTTGTADFLAAPFSLSLGDSYGSGARGSTANMKWLIYDFDYLGTNYRAGYGVHSSGIDFMALGNHQLGWWLGATEMLNLSTAGNFTIKAGQLVVSTQATPASATATGVKGTICHDTNYIYVCTATNTWKRVAIATW